LRFAETEFSLSKQVGDTGATKREHLAILKRSGMAVPELDDVPQLPDTAYHVWQAYIDLVGNTEINYSEIKAWSDMTGMNIKAWELSAIMRLEKLRKNNV